IALGQRLHRRPAEVAAPRALEFRVPCERNGCLLPRRATAEALDLERLHGRSLTLAAVPRLPRTGIVRELGSPLGDALGGLEQLLPAPQLDARTAELLAGGTLDLVDREPAAVHDRVDASLCKQRFHGFGRGLGYVVNSTGPNVLEEESDRLGRVLLVRPDDACWPALDPARAVDPRRRRSVVEDHPATMISDRPAPLVEGQVREGNAVIADAAKDEAALEQLALFRRDCDEPAFALLESIPHELDAFHLLLTADCDRRHEESEANTRWFALRLALGKPTENLHVSPCIGFVLQRGGTRGVEFEIGCIHEDVRARELAHLLELGRRKRCLRGSAAPDDYDLPKRR